MPNRIRELRTAAGLSRERLAADAGCSFKSVQLWEAQPHRTPSSPLLQPLADALGCTIAELIEQPHVEAVAR